MSDQIWYYQVAGEAIGPFTSKQMIRFAADSTIDRFTLIRRTEVGDWVTAETVKGFSFDGPRPSDSTTRATTPPLRTPVISTLPTNAEVATPHQPKRKVTLDLLLFGWTRAISYFVIAGLLLMMLVYSVVFVINSLPRKKPAVVAIAELKTDTAEADAGEGEVQPLLLAFYGIEVNNSVKTLFAADPNLRSLWRTYTNSLDYYVQTELVRSLESFATELEKSNLRAAEKRLLFEKFLFEQQYRITDCRAEETRRGLARADAVIKVLAAVGLSILASLVLLLLAIEKNTRIARAVALDRQHGVV